MDSEKIWMKCYNLYRNKVSSLCLGILFRDIKYDI